MTQAATYQVERVDRLDAATVGEVVALAAMADTADGAEPLSEPVLLRLRHGGAPGSVHLTIRDPDETLTGYGHLDPAGAPGRSAELLVHPARRRSGRGRALALAAADVAAGPLLAWAHGDHPSAAALALDLGFERVRSLWQLRRPPHLPVPVASPPAGVTLRAFRPGQDDEAWLAVNRRAFADHPEQGRWTLDELRLRLAEPWFDPAGFLLAVAESGDRLLGFHWTKVHVPPAGLDRSGPVGEPVGEVYVLGVDPTAHGLGLGRALTVAGLEHLRGRGLSRVMLYVDESNTGAVALYTRLGFARWLTHVQYRRSD